MSGGSSDQGNAALVSGRVDVKPATRIRSTLIMSSQKTLRAAGLFERYESLLPATLKDIILEASAPRWLDIEVGMAHYTACDALGLSPNEVTELAQSVAMQRKGTFLGIAVGLAAGLGVTPFTALSQADRIWKRGWVGGALAGHELGDKEAKLEVLGWPCARIPYCRHALRGLLLGVTTLLTSQAFAQELHALSSDSSTVYKLTWR